MNLFKKTNFFLWKISENKVYDLFVFLYVPYTRFQYKEKIAM